MTLTLEKAQICQTADGEPVVFRSQFTAYLEQRDQHREARINLSRDGSYLTLAEARELMMVWPRSSTRRPAARRAHR